MAADPPNASWHPALMPDHESRPSTPPRKPDQEPSPDTSPESLHNGTPLEPEFRSNPLDFGPENDGSADAWFAHQGGEGVAEGGAWLASQSAPPNAASRATGQADGTFEPAQKSPSKSQHSSSMSFARTVSHEPSFMDDEGADDDDEGDWSLPRTDTDPFKFMPPSDRTNSFPVPPPQTSTAEHHDEQPLPSNQALDVLEEAEGDWNLQDSAEDQEAPSAAKSAHGAAEQSRGRHGPSRSMGGDMQPFEEQADTRFEEGVPLMHQTPSNEAERTGADDKAGSDPFGEEGGQDDFFGQIGGDTEETGPAMPPLERKSTSQVLGNLNSEPPTRQNIFDAVKEEDESPAAEAPAEPVKAPGKIGHRRTKTADLNAKWQEAFGGDDDDDDFLLDDSADEKDLDATGFLGSDDEGLLDDADDAPSAPQPQPARTSQPSQRTSSNPYAPQNAYQPTTPATTQPTTQPGGYFSPPVPTSAFGSGPQYGRPPLPGSDQPKAQSFADKNKGGYASPYDLPSDIVSSVPKPRKRPSTQSLYAPAAAAQQAPPAPGIPRSTSGGPPGPLTSDSRPTSSDSQGAPLGAVGKTPSLKSKGSFFEELPMSSKPRSASRQGTRGPSPAPHQPQAPPQGPPLGSPQVASQGPPQGGSGLGPSPLGPGMSSQPQEPSAAPEEPTPPPNPYGNLVAPDRVSPYAALQTGAPMPQPQGNATRYSPAPNQAAATSGVPPPAGARYSPVPPVPRQPSYSPSRTSATSPNVLAHQPRTSSPLAHFESSNARGHGDLPLPERRGSSSSYEPRLNRVPSLPPTREVDEEEDQTGAGVSLATRHSSSESKYAPIPGQRQTPPPDNAQATFSPPKRTTSNYAPQPAPTSQPSFVPPPRAQTQSPGASNPARPTHDHARRPSSAHSHTAPDMSKPSQSSYAPHSRIRGASISMNMVPPTDGREQDPLQRWKGVPIFAWGVGGTVITTFPQSTPRYTISSSTPTITRTNGEVKVRSIKGVDPLPERLSKFPGPLKGKSRKKETIAWLTAGIETLEKDLPDLSFHAELSLEAKRSIERLLLWRILRVFIEHDGTLEGTPAVEKAVREILSPDQADGGSSLPGSSHGVPLTSMQADSVDSGTMDQIRSSLIRGEREAAVWVAADKRLWGHAMLIANTVSPDLYKQVAQEFVRKEVNYQGHNNESMAALYKILSGNYEDCVDELVPSHARAGFQMISTGPTTGPTKGAIDGLDKWRETLSLVLSNRSAGDVNGLNALGKLLASYGRAEAAHICFMFSRSVSIFGGLNDPAAHFVLLGSDHQQQASHFGKEAEALELSEVYEYGLTLAGGVAAVSGSPHLAAYKLQHAVTLAEYGHRDKALQYCDAIASAMASQTKRSPYYNGYLAAAVDDFVTRLKQAPKGDSGSGWISKPSMGKVSDSMWNKFNKFVAGDDEGPNGAAGANADGGPFTHIGATPTISRSPSVNNFEMYGSGGPSYGMPTPAAPAAAPSKYAPGPAAAATPSPYAPAAQYTPAGGAAQGGSSEYPGFSGAAPEASYPGAASAQSNPYAPSASYQPSEPRTSSDSHRPQGLAQSASMPSMPTAQPQESFNQGYQPQPYGYEPPQTSYEPPHENIEAEGGASSYNGGSFEPPSLQPYGYEPPSYDPQQPDAEDEEDATKPKTNSFMDDDNNGFNPQQSEGKSKADKDREADEAFRKAAEEDAKRAEDEKNAKKAGGWGFGSWFGGKKPASPKPGEIPNKPVRANLGEASSFVYDPELKRWVNKKPGAENTPAKTATPPPPRAGPRSTAGTPPPPAGTPPPPGRSVSGGPPPRSVPPSGSVPDLRPAASMDNLMAPPAPSMARTSSNQSAVGPPSAPPSRPGTSMSNASSIDDLISAGPRTAGKKKPRKSGRYVDVMAK